MNFLKYLEKFGYANLVEQVYGIQNELDILIEKAKKRVQKDSEKETA